MKRIQNWFYNKLNFLKLGQTNESITSINFFKWEFTTRKDKPSTIWLSKVEMYFIQYLKNVGEMF